MKNYHLHVCVKNPTRIFKIAEFSFYPSDELINHVINDYKRHTGYEIKAFNLFLSKETIKSLKIRYNEL